MAAEMGDDTGLKLVYIIKAPGAGDGFDIIHCYIKYITLFYHILHVVNIGKFINIYNNYV